MVYIAESNELSTCSTCSLLYNVLGCGMSMSCKYCSSFVGVAWEHVCGGSDGLNSLLVMRQVHLAALDHGPKVLVKGYTRLDNVDRFPAV